MATPSDAEPLSPDGAGQRTLSRSRGPAPVRSNTSVTSSRGGWHSRWITAPSASSAPGTPFTCHQDMTPGSSETNPRDPGGSISMRIRGGMAAPSQARKSVLSHLKDHIAQTTASDVAIIVSELVTNSVLHANVGPRRTVIVELTMLDDRVRISV